MFQDKPIPILKISRPGPTASTFTLQTTPAHQAINNGSEKSGFMVNACMEWISL
jgi:hypothetical protein